MYTITTLDNSFEGILWIKCIAKESDHIFLICVCYLPPEKSTRNSNPDEFYNTLLLQIFIYHNNGTFYVCGDFNNRMGNASDFIERVDMIPERDTVDFTWNMYGEKFEDFRISENCCMLNGRHGVCTQNDFTSISSKGLAVVDYCLVPFEELQTFSDFQVHRSR